MQEGRGYRWITAESFPKGGDPHWGGSILSALRKVFPAFPTTSIDAAELAWIGNEGQRAQVVLILYSYENVDGANAFDSWLRTYEDSVLEVRDIPVAGEDQPMEVHLINHCF